VKRHVFLVAALASAALASGRPAVAAYTNPALSFVHPGQDVVVKDVRIYDAADGVAGSNDQYYVVTFNFTNNLGFALAPRIDHFVFEDIDKRRYFGVVSGNSSLIGISNYAGVLKVGESHDYTVGFRVPLGAQGLIFYDASF
jgi:hypothetical protein